jgi:hypothetical protein
MAKKAFSTIATLVRIHLISLLDVYELLKNVNRSWAKVKTASKIAVAPSLFAT